MGRSDLAPRPRRSSQERQGGRRIVLGQRHGAAGCGDLGLDSRGVIHLGDAGQLGGRGLRLVDIARRKHDGHAGREEFDPLEPPLGLGQRTTDAEHCSIDIALDEPEQRHTRLG